LKETAMSSTELPRHIVDRFERRWAKKLEQQARAWKSVRSESRSLTNQDSRRSTGAALAAATKISLKRAASAFADTTG
jgi:hypothetical protein